MYSHSAVAVFEMQKRVPSVRDLERVFPPERAQREIVLRLDIPDVFVSAVEELVDAFFPLFVAQHRRVKTYHIPDLSGIDHTVNEHLREVHRTVAVP